MRGRELIAWAAALLQREHKRGKPGEVRVQMHEGVIQRTRVRYEEGAQDVASILQREQKRGTTGDVYITLDGEGSEHVVVEYVERPSHD